MTCAIRVGIAHSEYAADFLGAFPGTVDYVEVPFERLLADPGAAEFDGSIPLVLHCSSLSIAGTRAPPESVVRDVARWAKKTRTPWIGEHLAFVTAAEGAAVYDVGFTVSPVMSAETLRRVVSAVKKWTRRFRRPLLLENSPMYFVMPGTTMAQPEFFRRLCRESNVGILLDLTHLLATIRNLSLDAVQTLQEFPLERVVEIHISGLSRQSGIYWDDHASPAPSEVFSLLSQLMPRARSLRAVTLEYNWDPAFAYARIVKDVARIRKATRQCP
jgi:uncharacterized protein